MRTEHSRASPSLLRWYFLKLTMSSASPQNMKYYCCCCLPSKAHLYEPASTTYPPGTRQYLQTFSHIPVKRDRMNCPPIHQFPKFILRFICGAGAFQSCVLSTTYNPGNNASASLSPSIWKATSSKAFPSSSRDMWPFSSLNCTAFICLIVSLPLSYH